jgi:hypothetical protein
MLRMVMPLYQGVSLQCPQLKSPARAHELLRLVVQFKHEMAFCISNQTGMLYKNALERI